MATWTDEQDWDDDSVDEDAPGGPSLHDREMPDEADVDPPGDDVETVPCPYCRKAIYEHADVCPHCRSFISLADAPRRYPVWIVVTIVVCLLMMLIGWVL